MASSVKVEAKSVRKADTSRSSGQDRTSTARTTAMEARRVPALTVAYSPKESHDIKTDIIFVGPSPLSDSRLDSKTHVHWPSQLLPTDVQFARVLMYHYPLDTEMFSALPADTIYHDPDTEISSAPRAAKNLEWHAKKLLADLSRMRVDTQREDQKIIFVAQSIGGLIVQRTVTIASYSAVPQVEKHLLGIIFLGTPLRRYDRAGWASLGSNIARLGDLSERTLSDQMMSASVYLDTLSSGFYRVLDPRSEGSTKVNIAAFYEELPTPKIGFVVSRQDTTPIEYISNGTSNGIYATHANLARFSKKSQPGYRMVTTSIRRWIGQSGSQAEHTLDEYHTAALDEIYPAALEIRSPAVVDHVLTIALDDIHTAAVNYLRSSINASLEKYEPLVNAVVESSYGVLISAYLKGVDTGGLEKRLDAMPSLLSRTYDRALSKIDMSDDHQYLQMMAVVLSAVRPLYMQEICLIVDAWDETLSNGRKLTIRRQEKLESELLAWSRGLLSVQSGLVVFVHVSAYEHVKNSVMSRLGKSHHNGDHIILRACLLHLKKSQEKMKRYCGVTDPELSHTGAVMGGIPFFRYAVTYWVQHGIRTQRKIDPRLFETEFESMHESQFETWKYYFSYMRETSEGNTAQQEVESYFSASVHAVTAPIKLVSQINEQAGGGLRLKEADSPNSTCEYGPNLGFRSAHRENGATGLDLDQKEADPKLPQSEGTVAARLDILKHQSVEDSFSPILSSEASKIGELLLALLVNDDILRQIYKTAVGTMSLEKFEKKLHVLLGSFANDLHEEAHSTHEEDISEFYGCNCTNIARYIRILFTKEKSLCDDDIGQRQKQLPNIPVSLVPILSARWSSQTRDNDPNIVRQLENFVTNSKAIVTLRTSIERSAEPTTSFSSSTPKRQASAAVLKEERSPILEKATDVPSDKVENSNIRQLFVASTISKLLEPPLVFNRSLLFGSSRYIVGQVLGFLQGLNLYEPPLSANCVRLKWICICGNTFFRDFVLSEVSSAYGLRDLLLISGYRAALFANPSNSQAAAHGSDVERQSSTTSINNQDTRPGPSSYHATEPSNPSQNLGGKVFTPDDTCEVLQKDSGLKAMWIIICFYYNRHVSQAVHLDTQDGDDDVSLIKHARQKHFEKRGWLAYYMSWKAVTKIAFVKFGYILDPIIEEGLALLHEDWVPPEGWKDTKLWEPCPAEPRPMAEQRFLLHLWDHPHHSLTYLVIQTTKLRLIEQAKSLLKRWRIQKKHYSGWLKEIRDQYKCFRGWNTSSEQLPYSNPNNLQRIDDPGDSALRPTGKGRYLFKSTPKRLEIELQAHLDEPPLGWGLHFEESIVVPAPLRYLGVFIIIAMILSAVVSALVLVHEKGVAYFGMGNFGIGIASIVTTVVLRLIAV